MKRKSKVIRTSVNEHDELIAAYFDQTRLLRELKEFYTFTSFRRSHDFYENPMHTHEFDIVEEEEEAAAVVDEDFFDLVENESHEKQDYSSTPSNSPLHQPLTTTTERPSEESLSGHSDKNISFETSTTMNTSLDSMHTKREPFTADDSVMEEGLSRASPNTHVSGVSYSSENSSISDLKLKKRLIERNYERRFPRFPSVVSLSSSNSLRSYGPRNFIKGIQR